MEQLKLDRQIGHEVLEKAGKATWWDWSGGSVLVYWRWLKEYRQRAKCGLPVHFIRAKPTTMKKQRQENDEVVRERIRKKVQKVLERQYLGYGPVESLISFFSVPKGKDDIRVVYNGTSSGLNEAIWVPRFPLPTMQRHLRQVDERTFMADADLGEMFLNFPLHKLLRRLCGVDLSTHIPKAGMERHWVRWERAAMGLRSSPYQCTQGGQFVLEMAMGDRRDPTNVFRWERVELNLPGSPDYKPSRAWVTLRRADGSLASFVVLFVDDLRVMAGSERECWLACRRVASTFNYVGVQDAARKRRSSTQEPGAWAGGVVQVKDGLVYVLVTQEKWDRVKEMIRELKELADAHPDKLNKKRLEQIRGYVGYVSQTYPIMATYLKGLHLTIDGWRDGRDDEGWKLAHWEGTGDERGEPVEVKAVPRLIDDVRALEYLTSGVRPPKRKARMDKSAQVLYGFGDASARGFGATLEYKGETRYEYGQWLTSITEETTSNWKELANLIDAIEGWYKQGLLRGAELWLFTDNTTAENAFWKGTSKSKRLFELVLRMKNLEMQGDFTLQVVHVSGKRMIAQGTDGISRGDKSEGVLRGMRMTSFIPLHLGVIERRPGMATLIQECMGELEYRTLSPEGWFEDVNCEGNFVWVPPPSCGEVVLEQIGNARHKRPNGLHIVVIPRLMTGRWRRLLSRVTDFTFTLWDDPEWPLEQEFEPCLVFVGCPYISHRPLLNRTQDRVAKLCRSLSKIKLQENAWREGRIVLRKFLSEARGSSPM